MRDPSFGARLIDLSQQGPPRLCHAGSWIMHRKEQLMLDIFMLALGLGFFAASIAYAYACERL